MEPTRPQDEAPPPEPHGEAALPQGQEPAPPGARLMGLVRWLIVLLAAAAAVTSLVVLTPRGSSTDGRDVARLYCPMHPNVTSDRPGDCPICGMTLVPMPKSSAGAQGAAPTTHYHCPMHPKVTSDRPGGKCPDCGMNLEPVPLETAAPAAAQAKAEVPGLVPVTLDARRVQLGGIRTAAARREQLRQELQANGVIAAREQGVVKIHARVAGWIERLDVSQTGARVRRGQVLATIYSPQLLVSQQELVTATRWRGSASAGELERSIGADARQRLGLLGVAPQDLERIAREGALTTIPIRSPVTGHVTRKGAFQGLYIHPDLELFEIADLSRVWVLAEIYPHEAARVRTGQAVWIEVPGGDGGRREGKIQLIYPTLDDSTRTVRIRIETSNADLSLRPGAYVRVGIRLEPAEGLVIPTEAVVDSGDRQYVFVEGPAGVLTPRRVVLGARADDHVEIASGLAPGDAVVTTGVFLVDSESRLRAALERGP